MKKIFNLLILILTITLSLFGCTNVKESVSTNQSINETTTTKESISITAEEKQEEALLDKDGYFTTAEQVALYIHLYSKLPNNFITKSEAEKLGWQSSKGNLWLVTDKKSIGGDIFYNREGLLPKLSGRTYHECDINYNGGYRGAERIVYSSDGLIFYTSDHYESFTMLYGE